MLARRIGDDLAELAGASVPIHLVTQPAGTPPSARVTHPRDYDRHWTPVHLDFHVDDLDAILESVRAQGGAVEMEFRNQGPMPVAFCCDPFGNGFCVIGEREGDQ